MDSKEQHAIVYATLSYLHSTSGAEFVRDVLGNHDKSYENEKAEAWGRSPVQAAMNLDKRHLSRLAETVIQRYGDAGRQRASEVAKV
jgi:hypothetical protein